MALMPKRVKHRKSQRGRIRGNATRGNRVVFGDFGLQTTQEMLYCFVYYVLVDEALGLVIDPTTGAPLR